MKIKPLNFNDDSNYIKIPLNGVTAIALLSLILSSLVFSNWFFGNYQPRLPFYISVKAGFQTPWEARVIQEQKGVSPVNAEEKITPTPKKVSMIQEVQAAEIGRTTVPIKEGEDYIRSKFAEFGEREVNIAIAISKSENFINGHPGYFDCDLYGAQNRNGTIDLGTMQINSINWEKYGGEENLKDCFKNWDAGYEIRKSWQNWSAWSAFNNGSYLNFMN